MIPERMSVAIAWFRREQWELLRAVSEDADELEPSYDLWLSFASKQVRELEAKGIRVQKVEVEVAALKTWCESEMRPVDGGARAEYARLGLGRLL